MDKKEAKANQKAVKNFHKMLKLPKNASRAQIDQAVITYVTEGGDLEQVALSEAQYNDVAFLAALYKANPKAAEIFTPPVEKLNDKTFMELLYFAAPNVSTTILPGEKLQNDADFMLMYADVVYKSTGISPFNDYTVLKTFKNLISNFEFLDRFMEKYPDTDLPSSLFMLCRTEEEESLEEEIYHHFPIEFWADQVRKHGYYDYYTYRYASKKEERILLEAAVERDGFKVLKEYVWRQDMLYYKDLVFKAAEKDGPEALREFLFEHQRPYSIESYEPEDAWDPPAYSREVFDEQLYAVQQGLFRDPKISAFLRKNGIIDEKSTEDSKEEVVEEKVVEEKVVEEKVVKGPANEEVVKETAGEEVSTEKQTFINEDKLNEKENVLHDEEDELE